PDRTGGLGVRRRTRSLGPGCSRTGPDGRRCAGGPVGEAVTAAAGSVCRTASSNDSRNEEPMSPPLPDVPRRDRGPRALIALSGEIDLTTIPLVRSVLVEGLGDHTRTVDIDLSAVTFCDVSG